MHLNAIINSEKLSGFDRQEMTGVTTVWGLSLSFKAKLLAVGNPLYPLLTLCVNSKYFWHAS